MSEEALEEVKFGLKQFREEFLKEKNLDYILSYKHILNKWSHINTPFIIWFISGKDKYLTLETIGDFLEDYNTLRNNIMFSSFMAILPTDLKNCLVSCIINPCDNLLKLLEI